MTSRALANVSLRWSRQSAPRLTRDAHPLFSGVADRTIAGLAAVATHRRLREGERLGPSDAGGLALLERGGARIVTTSEDGRVAALEELRGPAVLGLGERDALVALEPAGLWEIPLPGAAAATAESPELCRNLLHDAQQRLRVSSHRMRVLAFCPAPVRLRLLVVSYARAFGLPVHEGVRIRVPLSQEDLAQEIHATLRSVVRAIKELRDARLVSRTGRYLVVHDCERLAGDLDDETPSFVHTTGASVSDLLRPVAASTGGMRPWPRSACRR
jgi:CRP/FNR family transcriptional regulator